MRKTDGPVGGERRRDTKRFTAERMNETDAPAVKEGMCFPRYAGSVERVPDEGMPDRGQMQADLMGAAVDKADLQKRAVFKDLQSLKIRLRRLAGRMAELLNQISA